MEEVQITLVYFQLRSTFTVISVEEIVIYPPKSILSFFYGNRFVTGPVAA